MTKNRVETGYFFKPISININGKIEQSTLIQLVAHPGFNKKKQCIPAGWPDLCNQKGQICGIIAFYLAGMYRDSTLFIPPPRKEGNPIITSLRDVVKNELKITEFGAIFDYRDFIKMSERFGITDSEALDLPHEKIKYIETLCDKIKSGFTVIIPCDVKDSFPDNRDGLHPHWALLFGWLYLEDKIYFLVDHHNRYCLWSAEELFDSNQKLPDKNPLFGSFLKIHNKEYIKIADDKLVLDPTIKIRKVYQETYDYFRFKGCAIKALQYSYLDSKQEIYLLTYNYNVGLADFKNLYQVFPKIRLSSILLEKLVLMFIETKRMDQIKKMLGIFYKQEGDFLIPSIAEAFAEYCSENNSFNSGEVLQFFKEPIARKVLEKLQECKLPGRISKPIVSQLFLKDKGYASLALKIVKAGNEDTLAAFALQEEFRQILQKFQNPQFRIYLDSSMIKMYLTTPDNIKLFMSIFKVYASLMAYKPFQSLSLSEEYDAAEAVRKSVGTIQSAFKKPPADLTEVYGDLRKNILFKYRDKNRLAHFKTVLESFTL